MKSVRKFMHSAVLSCLSVSVGGNMGGRHSELSSVQAGTRGSDVPRAAGRTHRVSTLLLSLHLRSARDQPLLVVRPSRRSPSHAHAEPLLSLPLHSFLLWILCIASHNIHITCTASHRMVKNKGKTRTLDFMLSVDTQFNNRTSTVLVSSSFPVLSFLLVNPCLCHWAVWTLGDRGWSCV